MLQICCKSAIDMVCCIDFPINRHVLSRSVFVDVIRHHSICTFKKTMICR
ncbi:hypothetical protein Syun_004646 [Stephania yunnanensis]|uniref:Uncharacterized protein n=1 Tax=Stephania yunnanensis TaxID=152371 RepID=A0AAP0L6S1_9MAGN